MKKFLNHKICTFSALQKFGIFFVIFNSSEKQLISNFRGFIYFEDNKYAADNSKQQRSD